MFDVIVVGAGPAGSTTARECAQRGLSVLLLDKAEFPRDKPCGGGVNWRSAQLLPFPLDEVTERTVYGVSFTIRQQDEFERRWPEPITFLTQRSRLDAFLVERAIDAGVRFQPRCALRSLDVSASAVTVRNGRESFQGKTIVAADGANGQTARIAGIKVKASRAVALEANLTPSAFPDKWKDMLALDLFAAPGGYGWLFPKGSHVNIGVGAYLSEGPTLRGRLANLVRFYGFNSDDMWGVRGHHLPMRLGGTVVSHRAAAVGDAAGLIDPLTGDGIHAAVWSGRSVSKHISAYLDGNEPDLTGYQRDLDREIAPELRMSRLFHYLFPYLPRAFIQQERTWAGLARIMRGERTYVSARSRFGAFAPLVELFAGFVQTSRRLLRQPGL